MNIGEVSVREFSKDDLESAMRLKDLAGWNQTTTDWERLLRLAPGGCFVALAGERVVATITTTAYSRELAWIGMVLVDPDNRRQGIATRLIRVALDYLKRSGVRVVKLDATPAGQLVYENLGFEVESLVERWSRSAQTARGDAPVLPVWRSSFLPEVIKFDRGAFGANRSKLLRLLIDDSNLAPSISVNGKGRLSGYALARPGALADYVGPIVAVDAEVALGLLDETIGKLAGRKLYVDVNTTFGISAREMSARGFVKQRELIRMRRGERSSAKTPDYVFAIAGPEVG